MPGRIKAIFAAGAAAALLLAAAYSTLQRDYAASSDRFDWRDITAIQAARGPGAAALALEERLRAHPNDALLHYFRARLYYDEGLAGEALKSADRAIGLGYAQELSHLLKALVWGRLRGDRLRQRDLASKALSYDPAYDEGYLVRAEAEFALGDDAACAADAAAYCGLRPEAPDGYELALLCRERSGDLAGAQAAGLELVRLRPAAHAAHWRLGRVYAAGGLHVRAVGSFSEAIRLAPGFPDYYLARAASRAALGEFHREAEDYAAALRWSEPADRAGRCRLLGAALHRSGELAAGLAAAGRAVELEPGAAENYELRGRLRAESGDLAGARLDLWAAAALAPGRARELERLLPPDRF